MTSARAVEACKIVLHHLTECMRCLDAAKNSTDQQSALNAFDDANVHTARARHAFHPIFLTADSFEREMEIWKRDSTNGKPPFKPISLTKLESNARVALGTPIPSERAECYVWAMHAYSSVYDYANAVALKIESMRLSLYS